MPISATSMAAFMQINSSGDLITLACSKIDFASTTSIPFLFKSVTAGPFKTSIAIFFDLKYFLERSKTSLIHFFNSKEA